MYLSRKFFPYTYRICPLFIAVLVSSSTCVCSLDDSEAKSSLTGWTDIFSGSLLTTANCLVYSERCGERSRSAELSDYCNCLQQDLYTVAWLYSAIKFTHLKKYTETSRKQRVSSCRSDRVQLKRTQYARTCIVLSSHVCESFEYSYREIFRFLRKMFLNEMISKTESLDVYINVLWLTKKHLNVGFCYVFTSSGWEIVQLLR